MRVCHYCQHSVSEESPFCPHCGAVFERHKIWHTPIDHRERFFSRRYQRFLFLTLRGRLNRERYITAHFFVLSIFFFYFIGIVMAAILTGHATRAPLLGFRVMWIGLVVGVVLSLLATVPLKIKRAHDLNCSAHWCWLWVLPLFGLIGEFIWWLYPGKKGANWHGLCPRGHVKEHPHSDA